MQRYTRQFTNFTSDVGRGDEGFADEDGVDGQGGELGDVGGGEDAGLGYDLDAGRDVRAQGGGGGQADVESHEVAVVDAHQPQAGQPQCPLQFRQGMHFHPARVTISLTGAKTKRIENGMVSFAEVPPGHLRFSEAETHATENIGGAGTRTYIIELKGKDWLPSTG